MAVPGRQDDLLERATDRHRAGDLTEARRLYGEILQRHPRHAAALFRSGLLELQAGQPAAALTFIDEAVAAAPQEPRHHVGRGQALQALYQWEEAAAAYGRALRLDSGSAEASFGLGLCLQQCGQLHEAAQAYQQALAIDPHNAAALSNLGVALQALGRLDEAVAMLRAAVELQPDDAAHALNLGVALCRQRDFAAADAVLLKVAQRRPLLAEAAFNRGIALQGLGRLREAIEQYRRALALRPDYADALNNLGNVHKELGEFGLAAAAYEAALGVQPDFVAALNNSAVLLRTLGRIDEAEVLLRRALKLDSRHAVLHDSLGSVLKDAGELDAAVDCFRASLALDPDSAAAHSNLVYALSFQSFEAKPILDECRRWNTRFAAGLRAGLDSAARPPHPAAPADATPGRLRIGYVSPDFRDHCQTLFTLPLLSHHDHAAFEIVCYSSVERPDDFTRRIAVHAEHWRDVRHLDDAALAQLIRSDRIDILVDLTMHMANGRPLTFARKPAAVQVAWLAYPGTTGIDAMDYRFTDPRLDPAGAEKQYSERSIVLPDSFWCYDPLTDQPAVNELPALARGHLTFGCLNNPCKLSDATVHLWSAVLRAVPDSRLLIMTPEGPYAARVLGRFAAHGVAAGRLSFVPFRPRAEYLYSYHDIDIGLDTFPYNGHTTSLDSLWMGVPVVTRVGRTCVGRGGMSQLFQVGLQDLAGDDDAAFMDAAVALAGDLPRLAQLRRELRPRLQASPLMDGARFARNVEAAYRQMWREYRPG
jgi:predicted O-linked N-acetylglucosamine transferase (SPINDLY family)